jgi:hypothetical protein
VDRSNKSANALNIRARISTELMVQPQKLPD